MLRCIRLRLSRPPGIAMQRVLPPGMGPRWPVLGHRRSGEPNGSSSAFNLNLDNGNRNSNHLGNTNNKRALCVRGPERDAGALFVCESAQGLARGREPWRPSAARRTEAW